MNGFCKFMAVSFFLVGAFTALAALPLTVMAGPMISSILCFGFGSLLVKSN